MKRDFEFALLVYADATASNDPDQIIFDNKDNLTSDLVDGASLRKTIAAVTVDDEIILATAACKVLYIKNLDATKDLKFRLNGIGNAQYVIGPGGVLYLESVNEAGTGLITSLHVSNDHATDTVSIKIFSAS